MVAPYGMSVVENCKDCKAGTERCFTGLSAAAWQSFEAVKYTSTYPAGAMLFVEGQAPRGVFLICQGRVKLSVCSSDGKTLILKIAEPGEVLGLSASVSARPYELSAETLDPCQVTFVRREDFLRLLHAHGEFAFNVAEQLSQKYNSACQEIRSLALSHSATEKLARLLVEWSSKNGEAAKEEPRVKLGLTQEEISQMIGTTRETVSRMLTDLTRRQIVRVKGSTLVVRDKAALRELANLR